MRTPGVVTGLIVLLIACGCAPRGVEPNAPRETFTAHLDERVPDLLARYEIPGAAIALIENGAMSWSAGYGRADAERRLSADTLFRAESISKTFTAWAVMRLVERGEIELDAPVTRYVEDWRPSPSPFDPDGVTVRRLLSHTAGIDYALSETGDIRLVQEPGEAFLYSNAGYVLLERLLEAVSEREFAEYLETEILRPLGMTRATYRWSDALREALVTGHDRDGEPVRIAHETPMGPGGLYCDVEELARFVAAGMRGPGGEPPGRGVLAAENVAAMQRPETPTTGFLWRSMADYYGLGYAVETLPDGRRAVGHGGEGHGGINWSMAVPESGDGIVILTNSKRASRLLAQLAGDWAAWRALPSVKLSRVYRRYAAGLWLLIGGFGIATLWLAARLSNGFFSGRRGFTLRMRQSASLRIAQASAALLLALLWQSALSPFLSHLFPLLAGWLGMTLLAFAGLALLAAFCPPRLQGAP